MMYAQLLIQPPILFFKIKKYLLEIKLLEGKLNIISGLASLIEGFRGAIVMMASGIKLII